MEGNKTNKGNYTDRIDLEAVLSKLGEYYEAEIPDTLDLVERAELGLQHFLSTINEKDYEMYWLVSPSGASYWQSPILACQAKAMEVMAMLRIMSGSRKNIQLEENMIKMIVSNIGEDGIYWVMPTGGKKPWLGPEEMKPFAHILGNGRMMRAMNTWYQYSGNPMWKELLDRMVEGMDKLMTVHKDDYAYFPTHGLMPKMYFCSCYVKGKGYKDTLEPANEKDGEEASIFNHFGDLAGGLANCYMLTGNKTALRLSGELVRFYIKPKFWADYTGGDYPKTVGEDHAHWNGHWHGYIIALRAILEYAVAANDPKLKQFARDGYEWARQKWFARIGMVDAQGCGLGRLIGLAVKLCNEGVGDYWEDVDLYIRNHAIEMQHTPDDIPWLKHFSEPDALPLLNELYNTADNQPEHGDKDRKENALDMMMGGFSTSYSKVDTAMCCSTHGNMGLFYAWDGMLEHSNSTVRINLLLNRASPWVDINSYLPYEGKVVIKNKSAAEIFVRIPLWVEKNSVKAKVNNKEQDFKWFNRYIRLGGLAPSDIVEINFPVVERIEKWSYPQVDAEKFGWTSLESNGPAKKEEIPFKALSMKFKGNTLVELDPIPTYKKGNKTWPYRNRPEKYESNNVKNKKVLRFATPFQLKW